MLKKEIVFVTNNAHKLEEVKKVLNNRFKILSLEDLGYSKEIPEPFDTLEKNACIKSKTILTTFGLDCFADDTGLEVDALNGAPGVLSARYAGPGATYDDNVDKLLIELKNKTSRKARFRTVICLYNNKTKYLFHGSVQGQITHQKRGSGGFGYDPVFLPNGWKNTFSEMSQENKNKISHRAIAVNKLVDFLEKNDL